MGKEKEQSLATVVREAMTISPKATDIIDMQINDVNITFKQTLKRLSKEKRDIATRISDAQTKLTASIKKRITAAFKGELDAHNKIRKSDGFKGEVSIASITSHEVCKTITVEKVIASNSYGGTQSAKSTVKMIAAEVASLELNKILMQELMKITTQCREVQNLIDDVFSLQLRVRAENTAAELANYGEEGQKILDHFNKNIKGKFGEKMLAEVGVEI